MVVFSKRQIREGIEYGGSLPAEGAAGVLFKFSSVNQMLQSVLRQCPRNFGPLVSHCFLHLHGKYCFKQAMGIKMLLSKVIKPQASFESLGVVEDY